MAGEPGWVSRLRSVLPPEALGDAEVEVDGLKPTVAVHPRSPEEVSSILRVASEEGLGVIPMGGGTMLHLGNPPRMADILLHTDGLKEGFDHSPEDLVVTIPAGMTVAGANEHLRSRGQVLPVDPPHDGVATIGGLVATNGFGPRRQHYGPLRDSLLGLKVVLANGDIIKAGGRVVKNVTGYDMVKLYTGSLGTLGVVVEATFKLRPLPERIESLAFGFPTLDGALRTAEDIQDAGLAPMAMTLMDPSSAGESGLASTEYHLLVEFGDVHEVVKRQVRESSAMARSRGGDVLTLDGSDAGRAWRAASCLSGRWNIVFRCSVPPAAMDSLLNAFLDTEAELGVESGVLANPGFGSALVGLAGADAATALRVFEELTSLAVSLEGHAILERAPPEVKGTVDVWGPPPPGLKLMSRLKEEFDPGGVLNPGRFIGGL